jgi:NAD(P)-dependent dehydrogenase (short-subunit alcohol dehydrogenase family)
MLNEIQRQFNLDGKTILVTGASSGIGKQTAINISAMGGKVVATGRSATKLAETLAVLSGEGHGMIVADLTSPTDVEMLMSKIDTVNGVVHSAGIVEPFPTRFINDEKINQTFSINYNAPVVLMSSLLRLRKLEMGASIVFISSFSAAYPYPTGGLYVSAKAALEAYSKVLSIENVKLGLRSNCVCPALVKTGIYYQTFNSTVDSKAEEKMKRYESLYPLGIGQPSDVANTIIFLLSDASKWITGQSIVLDGGYLLGLLSTSLKD